MLSIKNKAGSAGRAKKIYKIWLVYEGTTEMTYSDGVTESLCKFGKPIKLAETYSPGTAYIIAQAMANLYNTAEHAERIEIR